MTVRPTNPNRARQMEVVARLSQAARQAVRQDRWWRKARSGRLRNALSQGIPAEPEAILASLHAAVVARPRDLKLRQTYAERLAPFDPPRSRFIVQQLASDRLGPPDNKESWALMREQVPYTDGARTWRDERAWGWKTALRALDVDCEFRRGFAESISLAAARFVALAPKLATLAPIRSIKLTGDCHKLLADILEQPLLRQIDTLDIQDKLLDRHLRAIAAAPFLRGLKALHVGPLLAGRDGWRAIAGMPALTRFWVAGGDPLIDYEYDPENHDCMTPPRTVRSALNLALGEEFGPLPWLFDYHDSLYSTRELKRRRRAQRAFDRARRDAGSRPDSAAVARLSPG